VDLYLFFGFPFTANELLYILTPLNQTISLYNVFSRQHKRQGTGAFGTCG